MDNWTILTERFKAHSLVDDKPFQHPEMEDRDSGTESDVEHADLQTLEALKSSANSGNSVYETCSSTSLYSVMPPLACSQSSRDRSKTTSASTYSTMASVTGCGRSLVDHRTLSLSHGYNNSVVSPTNNITNSVTGESFHPVSIHSAAFQTYSHDVSYTQCHIPGPDRDSPTNCSDYERCGLDYEPDSSEDELSIINCIRDQQPEKRKWSSAIRCNSCEDNSESSDEDIRDSKRKPKLLKFGSSPPKGVHRLGNTLSPAQFMANLSFRTVGLSCVPPRKRHKQMNTYPGAASDIQRPCLDFEKMQLHWLRHNIKHRRRRNLHQ